MQNIQEIFVRIQKNKKKMKDLKNLTKDELNSKVRAAESELFQSRMKLKTGQLANTAALWSTRKDIARMKTLISQAKR